MTIGIVITFIIIIISLLYYFLKKSNNKNKASEKLSICSFTEEPLTVINEDDQVTCLLCLKNKNFCAGKMNGLISVYSHEDFSRLVLIEENYEPITSLSELRDNTILTSSSDGTLRKIKLLINDDENKKRKKKYIVEFVFFTNQVFIVKGIQLYNSDDILSSNINKELILWKLADKNELDLYKVNKTLLNNEYVYDILPINENLFMTSGDSLRCWDVKKYESIKKLNYNSRSNSLYKLNEDLVGILLKKLTDILIFNTKDLIDVKVFSLSNFMLTSLKSLSNNTILVGIYDDKKKESYINQYELNINELKKENEEKIDYNNLKLLYIKSEQVNYNENDPYFEEFNWVRINVIEEVDDLIVIGGGGEEKLKKVGKLIVFEKNEI